MSCQYRVVVLFLCGITAFSVSTRTCGKELLEGTSCTIKLKTKRYERPEEIKWIHLSSSALIIRKRGKIKTNTRGVKMEDDGSLTFESVRLKDSGKYKYYAYNDEGREIANGEEEINVYAKAPKPTVKISCKTDGDAALTCDIGDHTNLIISWYKEAKIIQNEKKPELLLTSAQVQQNKVYSCSVSNPVSSEQSDSITVSCGTGEHESSGPRKFCFDFWMMVSILASSGALLLFLLLLTCVLMLSNQRKKHRNDKRAFRLRNLQTPEPAKRDRNSSSLQMTTCVHTSLNTHKSAYESYESLCSDSYEDTAVL